jgi:hypothetical protein
MKINSRTLHRDLGYFFTGLIIAFSLSGLLLNHRQDFNPLKYEYESREIQIPESMLVENVTDSIVTELNKEINITDNVRRYGVYKDIVWISYKNADLEYNKQTGKGVFKRFIPTPVIAQMAQLHMSISKYWIYYSDIFAISLIIIAITGMIFPKGRNSFRKYGWKLTIAGLVFPLIFLFFLS